MPKEWLAFFNVLQMVAADASRSGSTAERPTTNLYGGKIYFDTTLNKPIWYNPFTLGWTDATGATV